ncbi:MAG: leucyl aminopeptidase family protein [Pseudomonadota bacterium]
MSDVNLKPYSAEEAASATPIHAIRTGELGAVDLPEALVSLANANKFNGEAGSLLAHDEGVLLGTGDGADPLIAAAAADKLPNGVYHFITQFDPHAASLHSLGWLIGAYRFDRYKKTAPCEAILIAPENADVSWAIRAGASASLVRTLVNTPAGDMTPEALGRAAADLAEEYNAEASMIIGEALLEKNFPMIHAVGRAADCPPRLVDIRWGREDAPKITIIGKGVTFDSGGLNIKGASGMVLMKKDMGGAAHTLGLARMIMDAKLNVRLRVLLPTVENAISGNAFRPSDVLPSRKGLSVEIGNTDAEGRLILADALALGAEEEPELMISLATLTGAARVALGPEVVPAYTDDDDLAGALAAASQKCADPLWRMPLWNNYDQMLSSNVADLNHISGNSFAGSIIAALFLRRFVEGAKAWAHFDIYAWRPKAAPGRPVGAECQAIRAIFDVIESRFAAR